MLLKTEMAFDKGAAHKIREALKRHLLFVARDRIEKVVNLVFETALL